MEYLKTLTSNSKGVTISFINDKHLFKLDFTGDLFLVEPNLIEIHNDHELLIDPNIVDLLDSSYKSNVIDKPSANC